MIATKVYQLTSQIPKGCVSTYLLIAKQIHSSPRAVGQALKKNPFAPKVPCHRVVATSLSLGGFHGGVSIYIYPAFIPIGSNQPDGLLLKRKKQMLQEEGVLFTNSNKVNPKCLYTFSEEKKNPFESFARDNFHSSPLVN